MEYLRSLLSLSIPDRHSGLFEPLILSSALASAMILDLSIPDRHSGLFQRLSMISWAIQHIFQYLIGTQVYFNFCPFRRVYQAQPHRLSISDRHSGLFQRGQKVNSSTKSSSFQYLIGIQAYFNKSQIKKKLTVLPFNT